MKQAQWKLIVLTLIVASLALTGCSYERKTPSQVQSTAQAGSAGVPTAALIAATTTPAALAVPTKQPTTLAIQATATPQTSTAAGATTGSASTTSTTTEVATTPATSAPLASVPAPAPNIGVPPAQEMIHVVQPGQNLFRIALQYGYDVETVAHYNGIRDPEMIFVGQEIRIPATGATVPPVYGNDGPPPSFDNRNNIYVVQPGDTMLSIAARFDVTVDALCAANHLADADTIYVGQTLNVP